MVSLGSDVVWFWYSSSLLSCHTVALEMYCFWWICCSFYFSWPVPRYSSVNFESHPGCSLFFKSISYCNAHQGNRIFFFLVSDTTFCWISWFRQVISINFCHSSKVVLIFDVYHTLGNSAAKKQHETRKSICLTLRLIH